MADVEHIYAGVVVGGPVAGKRVAMPKKTFTVEIIPVDAHGNLTESEPVRITYDYGSLAGKPVWTVRGWSVQQVTEALVEGYYCAEADCSVCRKSNKS